MPYRVALLPGDGIGPEVTEAAVRVIGATGVAVRWIPCEVGHAAEQKAGVSLPPAVLETIREVGVALKGPVATPIGGGHASVNVALRRGLDLYASLRPVRSLPGVATRYSGVDMVIVRENTEGLYAGIEHTVVPGVVIASKVMTERACRRIAEFAFRYARSRGRKQVTAVHKASIMKMSDGLFLRCAAEVARGFPEIAYQEVIIDNLCMQLLLDPTRYDVILLENLYGDILSDLCSGLVGGLGLVPGANLGERCAVFEAVHGTAPDIAGKGVADPLACILSGSLLLEHLGEAEAAARIRAAVEGVLQAGAVRTADLGGTAGTRAFTDAIVAALG